MCSTATLFTHEQQIIKLLKALFCANETDVCTFDSKSYSFYRYNLHSIIILYSRTYKYGDNVYHRIPT